jgi:hypothetical protein
MSRPPARPPRKSTCVIRVYTEIDPLDPPAPGMMTTRLGCTCGWGVSVPDGVELDWLNRLAAIEHPDPPVTP